MVSTVGHRLSERNEFELYWPILLLLFGLPVAIGRVPTPGSINALVDPFIARAWSVALVAGALTHLIGMAWKQPTSYPKRLATSGLILEYVGLTTQAAACGVFIIALAWRSSQTGDVSNFIGAGLVVFGLAACGKRAWKVNRVLQIEKAKRLAKET